MPYTKRPTGSGGSFQKRPPRGGSSEQGSSYKGAARDGGFSDRPSRTGGFKSSAPRSGGGKPYAPKSGESSYRSAPRDGGFSDRPSRTGGFKSSTPRSGGGKPYAPKSGESSYKSAPRDGGFTDRPSRSGGKRFEKAPYERDGEKRYNKAPTQGRRDRTPASSEGYRSKDAPKFFGKFAPPQAGKTAYSNRADRPVKPRVPREKPVEVAVEQEVQPLPDNLVFGRNPVREALKSGRSIQRLLVAEGQRGEGSVREIVGMAVERNIPVQETTRDRLTLLCQGAHHQGVVVYAAVKDYVPLQDILDIAKEKGEDALLLILDGIEDPQNLGAALRVAECTGAHGVIIPKRRAAGLTPAVARAASGAVEYVPVCQVVNLRATLETLKEQGIWIIGADMQGESCYAVDLKGPVALVIGNEGEGLARITKESCDRLVRLPMRGKMDSLNASAATAALLYEIVRQRGIL